MTGAQGPLNGGLYWVNDGALTLPPNDRRELHPRRQVLVLSGPDTNVDPDWPFVLVMPVSSSTTLKTRFCVKLAAGEGNVGKRCWIRVSAIQPLLKTDLQDRSGTIDEERLIEVHARLYEYMGLDAADED